MRITVSEGFEKVVREVFENAIKQALSRIEIVVHNNPATLDVTITANLREVKK